ncbi:MAG: EAL domain-containing protein [Leptolyngbya sp. DLM2.Bin15]|nr:MAG: EAL domain-containing protein [Leptolyngbya sp. DLM2.Bin15]
MHHVTESYRYSATSFVDAMQHGQRHDQIVETIVALSHQLGLEAIAEGIETREQLQQLQHLGYQFGQGYLASRPLCDDDTEMLLANHQRILL